MSQMKEQDKSPEKTTKLSGDRQSPRKIIQSNDSEDDPRSKKNNVLPGESHGQRA